MKRRKVKFAIEESDQEIRKIFSDQSMKVFRSNFEKRYVCLVEFRSGPAAFSFFVRPPHRSTRASIVPSPPSTFRVHTRFDKKGGPSGDGSPVERGTSACFAARRTICLSQRRTRPLEERSSSQAPFFPPDTHPAPSLFLLEQLRT